jgi:hypothetical protein
MRANVALFEVFPSARTRVWMARRLPACARRKSEGHIPSSLCVINDLQPCPQGSDNAPIYLHLYPFIINGLQPCLALVICMGNYSGRYILSPFNLAFDVRPLLPRQSVSCAIPFAVPTGLTGGLVLPCFV